MTKQKRTYSLKLVRENYTYSAEQIAELFGIEKSTALKWIREDGLKRIPKTRPYLVHSSELKRFISKLQKTRKKPCRPDEAYCCKCKAPRKPKMGSGHIQKLPNDTSRFQAKCSVCSTNINRVIGKGKWSSDNPLSAFLAEASKEHNGSSDQPLKCELQTGEQLCLNITP